VSWLAALPHQIPFRAASTGRRIDETTIEGEFLCTTNDLASPDLMLAEAMAQLAGGMVFREAQPGLLSAIDDFSIDRAIVAGDVVRITVRLEAALGGLCRFRASGAIDGVEVARGRFVLSSPRLSS